MTATEINEYRDCPGCGQKMLEKSGVYMCRTEDFVQERETRPQASTRGLIEGTNIIDHTRELPGGRLKTPYDYAHEAHHAKNIKEWYPEQAK